MCSRFFLTLPPMESLLYPVSLMRALKPPLSPDSNSESTTSRLPAFGFRAFSIRTRGFLGHHHHHRLRLSHSSHISDEDDPQTLVEELRVPDSWLLPSKALQESEWLRAALHKWLDDEYCPEETNIDISKVAAQSYYESLVAKQADIGLILLKMAGDLESLSFQESFHGAYSSANAAVSLILQRIESANQE